jgi:2-haloalkanoic acid dehalogenase type II
LVKNTIKFIFFDLGETLLDLSKLSSCVKNSILRLLPELNKDFDEFVFEWGHKTNNLFFDIREKKFLHIRDIIFLSLKEILKKRTIKINDKLLFELIDNILINFINTTSLYPDSIHVLKKLKQSNFRIGLITDCDLNVANGILKKHNLSNFFDIVIVSSEIKIYKPNPLIFKEALKRTKCNSNEMIYVGDSEIDIKGAKEIGINTVIINRNEIKNKKFGINPDFRIKELSELFEILIKYEIN